MGSFIYDIVYLLLLLGGNLVVDGAMWLPGARSAQSCRAKPRRFRSRRRRPILARSVALRVQYRTRLSSSVGRASRSSSCAPVSGGNEVEA